jgi:hypothetical protein
MTINIKEIILVTNTLNNISKNLLNLKNSIYCTKSWCKKILEKRNSKNCPH